MGYRHIDPRVRVKAVAMVGEGRPRAEVAKELGIKPATVAAWVVRAGLRKNTRRRKGSAARRAKIAPSTARTSRWTGPLKTVADLVTAPSLTDAQRVRMIAAFLNEK